MTTKILTDKTLQKKLKFYVNKKNQEKQTHAHALFFVNKIGKLQNLV